MQIGARPADADASSLMYQMDTGSHPAMVSGHIRGAAAAAARYLRTTDEDIGRFANAVCARTTHL